MAGASRAEEYAAAQKAQAAPQPQQPKAPAAQAAPQNPQMARMPQNQPMPGMPPQNPQMGMMPQNQPVQGMPQNPQTPEAAEAPQNPAMMQQGMMNPQMMGMQPMQGMMNPQMMGMMNPQMMGMPQTQFMGYDANGMPMYMQMMPQMMGYDAYGNPIYSMMPMQGMMNPQMMGMQPMMMQNPQMGMMPQAAPMPQAVPQPPVQGTMRVSSYEEMPVSAEALMNEDENAQPAAAPAQMPNEAELLNQIFSESPKHNTMSAGTKPSAQTFSINLSASEVTSVKDEQVPTPGKAKSTRMKGAEAAPEQAAPKKPTQRIVSPDEFFGDSSGRKMAGVKVNQAVINDEDELEEQLAALEASGKKKSKRSMKAADENIEENTQAAVENSAVSAAAKAILEAVNGVEAEEAGKSEAAAKTE